MTLNISNKKRVEELYNQKHRVVLPTQHLVVIWMGKEMALGNYDELNVE